MKCQADLSVRRPQATSVARVLSFTRKAASRLLELLKQLMEQHKFSRDRIYNCDETRISTA
jgi:hypothetical protein